MAKGTTKKTYGKNYWALFLLILTGIVLGGFFGTFVSDVPFLSWIGYGQSFGMTSPLVLDIGIMVITFGISIKISIASIVGVLIGILVYRVL